MGEDGVLPPGRKLLQLPCQSPHLLLETSSSPLVYRERQAFRLHLLNDPTDFFSKTTYVSSAACLQMSQSI